ncbi:MAG: tape measure protein [Pilosibacter sp.]
MNKQFVIGGTEAGAAAGAMVQLTQAMGSGALRGDELNSVLEAAPSIARNIEKYMGWAEGSIKKYAEKGMLSAEMVKMPSLRRWMRLTGSLILCR